MFVGVLELDVLFGDVNSLKEKRSLVRPVVAQLRRRFEVAVAETGHLDLHRRSLIGVSCVAAEHDHVADVLGRCERFVAGRPEMELLSARTRWLGPEDEEKTMVDQARARKLAKRISKIVADTIEHEVKDPRLTMVTITDTRVTGDLREATVYYTVLGESVEAEPDLDGAAAALASARGVLRSKVGAGTGVRYTPSLEFVPDVVPDEARRMEELLERTRASDAEVARLASTASPAGDADPYRAPREIDDEEDE